MAHHHDAGKGDKNNRISNWQGYYEAPIWEILEKRKKEKEKQKENNGRKDK